MSVRIARPHPGSFVTTALAAAAGVLAVLAVSPLDPGMQIEGAYFSRAQGSQAYSGVFSAWSEGRSALSALGVAVLVAAAVAALVAAARIVRTHGVPLVRRPWLALGGVAIAVSPWLDWADLELGGERFDLTLSGWSCVGPAGWAAVTGGAIVTVLAAGAGRWWHGLIPLAIVGALTAGWLTGELTASETVRPEPLVAAVALLLLAAAGLATRGGGHARGPSRGRGAALVAAGAALAATPWLPRVGGFDRWWQLGFDSWEPPAILAAGATALVCAVLLRPDRDGGTL